MIASLRKMLALTLAAAAFAGTALAQVKEDPPLRRLEKPEQFNGVVLARGLEKIFPPRINPVAEADITLTRFPQILPAGTAAGTIRGVPVWTTRSQKDGSFHFEGLKPGLYRWSASHKEFGEAEGKFELNGKVGRYERILLTRRPTPISLGAFAGRVTTRPPIRPLTNSNAKEDQTIALREIPVAGAIVEVLPAPVPVPIPLPKPLPRPEPLPLPATDAQPDISKPLPLPVPPVRLFRAETDKNGTFVIKGLPLGAYTFRVTHKEFAPSRGRFALTEKEPRQKRAITLERRVQGVFAGVVVERGPVLRPLPLDDAPKGDQRPEIIALPKGKPIAGALVSVWRARIRKPLPLPRPLPPVTKQGEPPAGGAPQAEETSAGGAVDEEADVPGDPGEDADGTEPGNAGDGKAGADGGGQTGPAGGGDAAAAGGDDDDDDVGADDGDAGEAPTAAASAEPAGGIGVAARKRILPRRRVRRARTDQNGSFAMKGLPAGIYRFTVRAKGFTTRRGLFAISRREPKVFRRIALGKRGDGNQAASFRGVVLTIRYSGANPGPDVIVPQRVEPVAGAIVRIVVIPPPNVKMALIERKETTNDKGEFAFKDLRPGQYVATVEAKGFFPTKETVEIAGETARKFYLKPEFLPPAPPPKPVEQPSVQGSDTENPFK